MDTNKDRLVSLEEFLKSTEKREFNNPKEWEVKSSRGGVKVGGSGRAGRRSVGLWFKSQDKVGRCGW